MHLQSHSLTRAAAFVAALVTMACSGTQALEDMESGTTVVIETADGRLVTGRLTSVDPEEVTLSAVGTDRRISIDRAGITEVRTADDEEEVPQVREVTIPSGSTIGASLETSVASDRSQVEDSVRATLTSSLMAEEVVVAPAGSVLFGTVTEVEQAGRVKGRARLVLRFDRLQAGGVTYDIRTEPLVYVGEATKSEDAAKIGAGAAAGAVIGAITGGGKGAAIGSAIGGGGGTAVVLATRGEELELGAGRALSIELTEALTVTTSTNE
jgi:hypothetical protein